MPGYSLTMVSQNAEVKVRKFAGVRGVCKLDRVEARRCCGRGRSECHMPVGERGKYGGLKIG